MFDLDGTLLPEKPHYVEVLVATELLKERAIVDPRLRERQPYTAVLAGDAEYISANGKEIVLEAARGQSLDSYAGAVRRFLWGATHPTLHKPYSQLFYAPILELISLLKAKGFDVYVVSTSQQEYIRAFSDDCLQLGRHAVIGRMIAFRLAEDSTQTTFLRLKRIWEPDNADSGKVLRIRERTGGVPILAVGNSMGDAVMLDAARQSGGLALLINHDDAAREFEYRKEAALSRARAMNWRVVSMREDFRVMFSKGCAGAED